MAVEVKGVTIPAIRLKLDPAMSIEDNLRDINTKLSSDFFKGSVAIIDYNDLNLNDLTKRLIEDKLKSFNTEVLGYTSGKVVPPPAPPPPPLVEKEDEPPVREEEAAEPPEVVPEVVTDEPVHYIHHHTLKIENRTLRGGQRIDHDGDVVIIGNVNADAYVVAAGNVIVFGTLRGIVHAGADGNDAAVVIALRMQPQQLKIGRFITRSPDKPDNPDTAEKAFVENSQIYIEKI